MPDQKLNLIHDQLKKRTQHHLAIANDYQNVNKSMVIFALALLVEIIIKLKLMTICISLLVYIIGCFLIMTYHEIKYRKCHQKLIEFEHQHHFNDSEE